MSSDKPRQVLTDETYERIKSLVMDQVIKPGQRISIDGLARKLKVSQTPIREALARLESEELVFRKPLIGYSATQVLTADELQDLYEFRMLIEPRAAELATKNLTPEFKKLLKQEMANIKNISTGNSYATYKDVVQHDAKFHQLILHFAGNKFLENAFEKSHCHLHLFRLKPTNKEFQLKALNEHLTIVRAIESGSAKAAKMAMVSHLEASRSRMLNTSVKSA